MLVVEINYSYEKQNHLNFSKHQKKCDFAHILAKVELKNT